ncbi:ABC transporter ATP-binding protein [Nocardiopsis sp. NRRL B-16309]|uniref:ABC transporter ATP-binding protein n=1 Tax=Nocardiopsis sp. NRRL B-16309 TaxID=1519494 RepID=UPI0006ADB43E|nr:ABC transporter ATP-binding protein [Nocardiopsis sp. NRRL B-16309]KOX10256.1 iron-dicitrate transporter ATP-binding subunit [Nocardiopsis sp. NRRL B-16309]
MAKGKAVNEGPVLAAEGLTLGYGGEPVVHELDLAVAEGEFTVIVGPNGCGKSTLLKALGRVNAPTAGRVLLHGADIRAQRAKAVARRLALLPQSPIAPEGITVRALAARGRFPHRTLLRQWSPEDEEAIGRALELTGLTALADSQVGALSGGQRQRAWVAMVLAQDTGVLLLDEPTTFLDIAHQYDLLELFAALHRGGRTVVAVLHDLAQAARFATRLVMMSGGRVVADGPPGSVVTAELVEAVFGLPCDVVPDPRTRTPLVIPHERA